MSFFLLAGIKLALVGHSIISYLDPSLFDCKFEIKKFAVRGGRTDWMIQQIPSIISWDPKVVFLQIGGNDILNETRVSEITTKIKYFYDELSKFNIKVFVGELLVRGKVKVKYISDVQKYMRYRNCICKILRKKKFPGMDVVIHTNLNVHVHFANDGIHLNYCGNRTLANIIMNKCKEYFN